MFNSTHIKNLIENNINFSNINEINKKNTVFSQNMLENTVDYINTKSSWTDFNISFNVYKKSFSIDYLYHKYIYNRYLSNHKFNLHILTYREELDYLILNLTTDFDENNIFSIFENEGILEVEKTFYDCIYVKFIEKNKIIYDTIIDINAFSLFKLGLVKSICNQRKNNDNRED